MRWCLVSLIGLLAGCQFFPTAARQPEVRNPFPQLSRVAIVEFFNGTADDSVVDGFSLAAAYASELQRVPGFEVVPPDIVRAEMRSLRMSTADLADPGRRRLLAESLGVDALATGIVVEYSPYYPPRLGLKVNWYAANPGFHPIPPGYGLPWGTPAEEDIPDSLVYEAEFALAKEQLKTQTPVADGQGEGPDAAVPAMHTEAAAGGGAPAASEAEKKRTALAAADKAAGGANQSAAIDATATTASLPPDWPDPRGFVPRPPSATRPKLSPSTAPVLTHTRTYHGHDAQFTAALRNFYLTRDEARFGGWQSYLQRSEDFLRFCCYLHIAEMLTARGGAGKTQVVWRWQDGR